MNTVTLKGKVVSIEQHQGKIKVAGFSVEVTDNNRTEIVPVLAFNKLADVVLHYTKVGDEVEVKGALRWNTKVNALDIVAFKVIKVENKNTKTDKKVTVIDKNEPKNEVKVANGPIKKLDRFDGFVVNVYENLSQAAEDMKVKKSALKKAIENGTALAGYKWSR